MAASSGCWSTPASQCRGTASSSFAVRRRGRGRAPRAGFEPESSADRLRIDTGAAVFELPRAAIGAVRARDDRRHCRAGCARAAACAPRRRGRPRTEPCASPQTRIEERGRCAPPSCARVPRCDGGTKSRASRCGSLFLRDSAALRIECEVWNPRAARHVGGLWDLGDAGSLYLQDLSLELHPAQPPHGSNGKPAPGDRGTSGRRDLVALPGFERRRALELAEPPGCARQADRGVPRISRAGRGRHDLAQGERATPAVTARTAPAGRDHRERREILAELPEGAALG